MIKSGSDRICISLSDELLRIIQIKGTGSSAKVTNIVSETVKGATPENLSTLVENALGSFKAKNAHISLIALPSFITTKNIEIPSTNQDEINSIVNLQASRHTPYTKDEIQVGYVNFGVYKDNYTKVLLVIANKQALREKLSIFEQAGYKVKSVLFPPEGVADLYTRILGLKKGSGPVGIIDIDNHSTNFTIILNGKAISARNIPVGREQLSGGEAAHSELIDELKNTIEAYQAEDIEQAPASYVLSSADDLNQALQGEINSKLGWDVQLSPYLDHVKASKNLLNKIAEQMGNNSFLDLIAASSSASKSGMNLIPEEIQLQKSLKDQSNEIFKALSLSVIILILVAGTFLLKWYKAKNTLDRLNDAYAQDNSKMEMLRSKEQTTRLIKNYLESRMVSLDVVYELYKKIPTDVYLNNIQMVDEQSLKIQGISQTASRVYKLRNILKSSEMFQDVEVKSQTARKDRGKDVAGFEMEITLNN